MSSTYDFQMLTIDIPKAEGGEHMGSIQWTINGRMIITSEAFDKTNHGQK